MRDNDNFIRGTFRRHLLPAVLSVAGVTVSTMANSLIAGNLLGHEALAVMSLVSPVYFAFATIGALLGVGGAAQAAWAVGRRDQEGADQAFTLSFLLVLGISVALTVLGILFLDPFLQLLGAQGALHEQTRQYTLLFLLGGLGTAGIYLPFNFLKLEGRLRRSVEIFLFMAALNIGLDFFFVLVFDLGTTGIALATTIAAMTAFVIGMVCLLRKGGAFHLRPCQDVWNSVGRLMAAGSPASLNNLATTGRTICLNLLIAPLAGAAGLSAFSIVTTAGNIALTVISGLGQTTAPFVGVFSQEKDNRSIRQLEKQAVQLGLALVLPLSVLFILFARPFCALFGISDAAVLDLAVPAVALFAISLAPSVLSTILVNYYLAGKYTWIANLMTVCRAFLFVVLPALPLSLGWGLRGVWLSFTLAELGTWIVLGLALLLYRRCHPTLKLPLLLDPRYEDSGRYISFSVQSSEEDIMNASCQITDFCENNTMTARRSMLISLALEEMLISIRDHSFDGDGLQDINVRILIAAPETEGGEGMVILRIRCSGKPFNPVAYYEAHHRENAMELDDSVGIRMIVKSSDIVDYQTTFGVNNLTIIL